MSSDLTKCLCQNHLRPFSSSLYVLLEFEVHRPSRCTLDASRQMLGELLPTETLAIGTVTRLETEIRLGAEIERNPRLPRVFSVHNTSPSKDQYVLERCKLIVVDPKR